MAWFTGDVWLVLQKYITQDLINIYLIFQHSIFQKHHWRGLVIKLICIGRQVNRYVLLSFPIQFSGFYFQELYTWSKSVNKNECVY